MNFDFDLESIIPSTGSLTISGTGALFIPTGTTGERPASPASGYIRYNTTLNQLEFYNSVAVSWQTLGNSNLNAFANLSGTGIVALTGTGTYATRTITGTASRITLTDGNGVAGNPTIDIAGTYAGQTSITTLGTIGTGTWNATTIAATVGGTGQTTYTVGDILYANTTTTLAKLADVATGNALISGGVGVAPSYGKIDLTTHVSGTLPIANGGTNLTTTPTNGQLLIGNGTNYTLSTITAGTGVSITNGAGTITLTNSGVTSIAGTTNQITASAATGAVTLSIPSTFVAPGSIRATTWMYQSLTTGITAAGATQGTATALTTVYNVVTTVASGTGVILPTPASPFGQQVTILNRGANALNVYPNSGAAIANAATNAAISLPVNQEVTLFSASATQWWPQESIIVAGTNVTVTPGPGTLTIAATGGSGTPGGANTNVQYNNAGAFGGSSAFSFIAGANPRVDILGTIATNQLRIGGSTNIGNATLYVESDTTATDTFRAYFNSGSPTSSGFITFSYDPTPTGTDAPFIRLHDQDDDACEIRFQTGGSLTAPTISNIFGTRGGVATATTGFKWVVNGTIIAEMDSGFLTLGNVGAPPFLLNTATGDSLTVTTGAATTATSVGNNVTVRGGAGGTTSGAGGAVTVTGGIPTSGAGGAVTISGANGVGTNQNGGNVNVNAGLATGTGTPGFIDMGATVTALELPQGTAAQRPGSTNMPTPQNGMIRYNTDDDVLEAWGTPYTTTISPTLFQRTMGYRKRRMWADEFCAGSSASTGTAAYGELGWTMTGSGTNANSIITAVADHPGILQIGSGTTSGNNARIHLGNAVATGVIMANEVESFAFLVRIPTITSITIVLGLQQDVSAASGGTNAVFFQFNPGVSANWQFITRSGSTSAAAIECGAVAANTWYYLEAYYNGTDWTPVVNGTVYTAQTTNIPTTAVNVGVRCQTGAAASRQIQLDFFRMISRELGTRY